MTDQKLREDMYCLLGKLEAIAFPLMWSDNKGANQAYYDLIDSIVNDYENIISRVMDNKYE